jgi:hypothetical protein
MHSAIVQEIGKIYPLLAGDLKHEVNAILTQ